MRKGRHRLTEGGMEVGQQRTANGRRPDQARDAPGHGGCHEAREGAVGALPGVHSSKEEVAQEVSGEHDGDDQEEGQRQGSQVGLQGGGSASSATGAKAERPGDDADHHLHGGDGFGLHGGPPLEP